MEQTMNNRLDERSLTEGLHPLDIDALVEARHPDPFSKLGLHQTDSGYVVRVLLPGASGVQVLARDSSEPLAELTQVHPAGLFIGYIGEPQAYRLNIDWHGTPQEVADTYSFGPVLDEERAARASHGATRTPCSNASGSRPVVHGGVCRACASPSGRPTRAGCPWSAISIPGMAGVTPCACATTPACGNCSVPRLGAGHALQVRDRHARGPYALPLKADPCAIAERAAAGDRFGGRGRGCHRRI